MKKIDFIAKYGEEAWEKAKERCRKYYHSHKEERSIKQKQYNEAHKEEIAKTKKQWRKEHKEELSSYVKNYYECHKEQLLENNKQYRETHKEEIAEVVRRYHETHKEYFLEKRKEWCEKNPNFNKDYYSTQNGRARHLVKAYKITDKKQSRGECTLTSEWVIDNIFTKTCIYCGEGDWRKLGCDRIDNDLPHTSDNVVCCCADCNNKRKQQGFEAFLYKSWRERFK